MKIRTALLVAACLVPFSLASLPVRAADKPATPSDPKLYAAWRAACADVNKNALAITAKTRHLKPDAVKDQQALISAFNQMHAARKPTKADLAKMDQALKAGYPPAYLTVKICYVKYTLGLLGARS